MSKHRARPDDDPTPGDRCKDCGGDITWTGPLPSDWDHIVDAVLVPDPIVLTVVIGDLSDGTDPELVRHDVERAVRDLICGEVDTATVVVTLATDEAELVEALEACADAAVDDSNDDEIGALNNALDLALARWPGIERPDPYNDDHLCGLCGMQRAAPGLTACSSCA